MAECHLETGSGSEQALGQGDTIGATITDRADVYVRPGATKKGLGPAASAAAAATAAAAEAAAKKGESLHPCARSPLEWSIGSSSNSWWKREFTSVDRVFVF